MPEDAGDTSSALAERRNQRYEVYEPAEDSAILAGEVVDDLAPAAPELVLDVGTGSGYVGARLATDTGARVIGVDVNPAAVRRAREVGLEVLLGDLTTPFRTGVFDCVVFNPPYLPAMEGAEWDDWFETAITGGETGGELVERFVDGVGRVLAADGVVYLLVSSLTGVDAVVDHASTRGFSAVAMADAAYPGETLTVLKLLR